MILLLLCMPSGEFLTATEDPLGYECPGRDSMDLQLLETLLCSCISALT